MLLIWLLALGTCVLPFLLGRFLGGRVNARPWAGPGRALVLLGLAILALASPFFPSPRTWLSAYDHALMSGLFALGLLLAERPGRPRMMGREAILPTLAVLAVGGFLVEWRARQVPGAPQDPGDPGQMHILFRREGRDRRCNAIFPDAYGRDLLQETWRNLQPEPGPHRVLHVGDSMVNSFRSEVFTSVLETLRPGEVHMNLGVGGTAPDAYRMMLHHWLDQTHPDEVVVHVFLGNDLNEYPEYQCCEAGPLVAFTPAGAMTQRCTAPRWADDARARWRLGPAPYALRVLGHRSVAAARVVERMERAMRSIVSPRVRSGSFGWGTTPDRVRNEMLLRAIRDEVASRRVPLTLSLLPARWTLESDDPADPVRHHHAEALDIARSLGIRTVDPWDVFQEAARHPAPALWFSPGNHRDPHFGDAGHAIYARWLHEHAFAPR
jgi:hypothetical protein